MNVFFPTNQAYSGLYTQGVCVYIYIYIYIYIYTHKIIGTHKISVHNEEYPLKK